MKWDRNEVAARVGWSALVCLTLLFAAYKPCSAEVPCLQVKVQETVRVPAGELTLADLLSPDSCARLRTLAQQVSLGVAPLPGAVRVLSRGQVRGWLDDLMAASGLQQQIADELPRKILVWRAGAAKSCAKIARLVLRSLPAENGGNISTARVDCAAALSLPEAAPLELTKTFWNALLQRWEFSLRCSRYEDCAPFLVWATAPSTETQFFEPSTASTASLRKSPGGGTSLGNELIKRGQTATLRWDEPGIRVVLPVTCLEGGGIGQTIRVRFKDAGHILQAQILSDGTLWAGL